MEAWSRKRGFAVALAVAALAIAAIAVGCGGDEDSSAGSGSGEDGASLSKAEFVKEGNAACTRERQEALERVAAYTEKHSSDGLSEAVLNKRALKVGVLATLAAEIKALRALAAPTEDEQELEAILTSVERDYDEAAALPATPSATGFEDQFAESDKQLRSYGLASCAK